MDKKLSIRLSASYSHNLKPKTCTELSRSIQNLKFGILIGAMLLTFSIPAEAQQPAKKIPRIGILSVGGRGPSIDAFLKGLHELGWVEGHNIAIEFRYGDGNEDRLRALAAQLVDANVDIIVSTSPRGTRAARQLTKNIPIIETFVGMERMMNLDHPSGNVTGVSSMPPELGGKRLELL